MVGAILVLIGVVMQIMKSCYAPYITAGGGILIFIFRIITSSKTNDFRVRRLMRMQFFSSFLLLGGAYFMYINNNAWALALFLAAFLDIFVMWRTPKGE